MKKKLIFVVLVVLACISILTACGEDTTEVSAPSAEPEAASSQPIESAQPSESAPAESSQPLVIQPVETDASQEDAQQSQAPAEVAAMTEDDFVIVASGSELAFDMTMDSVIAILGDGYDYSEAVSCAYDGMDKTYAWPDIEIYSWPDGDVDKVNEIMIFSDLYMTARGITVGSTLDEVVAAYGQGETIGSMVEYKALGHILSFGITDSVVTDIDLLRTGE